VLETANLSETVRIKKHTVKEIIDTATSAAKTVYRKQKKTA